MEDNFWAKVLFKDFIKHFRKLNAQEAYEDIQKSMDDIEDFNSNGTSFGSKMVMWAEERRKKYSSAKSNGSKGGRPKKKSPQRSDVTTGKPEANRSGSPTTAFGEYGNVTMSKDEETKLRDKLGQDFERAVEILANYKKSTGKSYKSDYGAINNWVVRRLQEEKAKGADQKAPRNMAEYYDRMIDKYFPEDFDDGQFRSNDT